MNANRRQEMPICNFTNAISFLKSIDVSFNNFRKITSAINVVKEIDHHETISWSNGYRSKCSECNLLTALNCTERAMTRSCGDWLRPLALITQHRYYWYSQLWRRSRTQIVTVTKPQMKSDILYSCLLFIFWRWNFLKSLNNTCLDYSASKHSFCYR